MPLFYFYKMRLSHNHIRFRINKSNAIGLVLFSVFLELREHDEQFMNVYIIIGPN